VADNDIEHKLFDTLTQLKEKFSKYYTRYFDVNDSLLFSSCISAKEWMKEKPLKEILDKPFFDSPDKIDDHIALLQKEISYGLPMLLKPIFDMLAPENMLLRFIEIGAYKPIARKMIELNIPRETAIWLSNRFFRADENALPDLEDFIIARLRNVRQEVSYWIGIQIDPII